MSGGPGGHGGVRGERLSTLQKYLISSEPRGHDQRRTGRAEHPRGAEGRASGLCHLSVRHHHRSSSAGNVSLFEALLLLLLGGFLLAVPIAGGGTLGSSIEGDVSEEEKSGLSPPGVPGLPPGVSARLGRFAVPASGVQTADRGRHSSLKQWQLNAV